MSRSDYERPAQYQIERLYQCRRCRHERGDNGAASDGEGCFYDGQALICGCPGWVSVDADGDEDPWINNGDEPCEKGHE